MTKSAKSTFPLRLPRSVKAEVERRAKADGTSVNQFLATAAAEKLAVMNTAAFLLNGATARISRHSTKSCGGRATRLRSPMTKSARGGEAMRAKLNERTQHRKNAHVGSSLDDFLKQEGIFEEVQMQAVEEVAAWQRRKLCAKPKSGGKH